MLRPAFGVGAGPKKQPSNTPQRCGTEPPALRRAFTVSRWVANLHGTGTDVSTLRRVLSRRRMVRRVGMALSSGVATTGVVGLLARKTGGLPQPGDVAVAAGMIGAAGIAASRLFRFEVGKDGNLYVGKRVRTLTPLHGRDSVDVRETGDGRGRGAFAARLIPQFTCLGAYEGDLLDNADFFAKYGDTVPDYVMALDAECVLDGAEVVKSSVFSPAHMNHSGDAAAVNVGRIHLRRKQKVLFFTLRDVAEGEELVFDYGKDYWRGREDEVM